MGIIPSAVQTIRAGTGGHLTGVLSVLLIGDIDSLAGIGAVMQCLIDRFIIVDRIRIGTYAVYTAVSGGIIQSINS